MPIRTDATAVAGICEVDASIDLTPFIETASALVDDPVATGSPSYTDAKLELIERWLAAHFYRIRDMAVQQEYAKGVGQMFQFKVDLNLHVTMYGQQAMLLDTDGNLAKLNKRAKDGISKGTVLWLGTGNECGDDISK